MVTDVGMKALAMGLAMISLAGVGVGIGNIFSSLIAGIARNPSLEGNLQGKAWIGFALVEAVAFYAIGMAFLILYLVK